MMRTFVASAIAAFAVTVPAWAQPGPRLTLDDAIAVALSHNRDVERLGLAEESAAGDVATARSRRLPRFTLDTQVARLLRPVDVQFPAGAFGSFPGIGPVPAVDTALTTPTNTGVIFDASVAQPITGLIQAGLGVHLSETALALKQEEHRSARLDVIRAVRHTYYSILEATDALAAVEADGRLLAEMSRLTANRVIERVALKSDGFELDARLAQNELNGVKLKHAIASGKEQLNALLGRDVSIDFDVVPLAGLVAPDSGGDAMPAAEIRQRPDVRHAALVVQQADLAVRLARADRLPEINVMVQAITPLNIDGAPQHIASAGIQLKWEPFDWGRRARAVASKRLELQQAERRERDVEDGARLEIARARRSLEEAQAAVRVAELSRRTAQERTRVRLTQFESQSALLGDVLQAQASLANATSQFQQALLALLTARADLDHALGEELVP
jgi:outer membrane protein